MEFEPKTFISKTGNSIKIRVPEITEAQQLSELKRSYIKNTTTIPINLDEYPIDLKKEAQLIAEYRNSPNSILLVAKINNTLIGNIDLTGSDKSKMFHTGVIGMGIKKEWRNQGLGRCLIESVIDWAKKHSMIELIWLDVYASNELGYHLYKNTGFKVSGIINDFFKDENGYKDKIQMFQRIKEKTVNKKT